MLKNFRFILVLVTTLVVASSCSVNRSADEEEKSPPDLTELLLTKSTQPGSGKPTLLLVGDSRVVLWPDGFFEDFDVTNLGVGGTTSEFAMWVLAAQTTRFDAIIISTGVNDFRNGISLNDSAQYIGACILQAHGRTNNVFVTTVPGVTLTFPLGKIVAGVRDISYRAAQLNTYLPTVTQVFDAELIDIAATLSPMWSLLPAYADSSGIHYNTAGYDVIYDMYMEELSFLVE